MDTQLFLILLLYLVWCFLTSFWSNIPFLSFSKSCLFFITSITVMSAGIEWVRLHPVEHCFDYLRIFTAIILLAGFIGFYFRSSYDREGTITLYSGLVHGANMFGTLLAMSLPFLLWNGYKNWTKTTHRIKWIVLIGSCLMFLVLSLSRSAIMAAALTSLGFLINLNLNKKIYFLSLSIIFVFIVFAINPSLVTNTLTKYLYKAGLPTQTQSLFFTRKTSWESSYDGAVQGGWFGLGYGISNGKDNDFSLSSRLTSQGYGREKGNSQLAIVEETGLVGFMIYTLLIFTIAIKLAKLHINAHTREDKILIGIVSGIFMGLLAQSCFEAWWTSPGSPESVYFWTLVGVIRGLEIVMRKREIRQNIYHLEPRVEKNIFGVT